MITHKEFLEGLAILQRPASVQVVKNNLLRVHISPSKFIHFVDNTGSWLTGFEKWIESKIGFDVSIFTCIQKQFFMSRNKENSYRTDSEIIVGPLTYQRILDFGFPGSVEV